MAQPESPGAAEGSLISHLLELRDRLLYALAGVGIVFVALLFYANDLYALIARPLMERLPAGMSMIATDVTSPFIAPIKLAGVAAFILTAPWVLYQVWAFVAPGLYRHERRLVIPLLVSSTVLFYAGMAFAYTVVFPLVFQFFIQTAPPGVAIMTDIKSYMDFVFSMFIAFGIAFEVPVAVVLLARMGVIDPDKLAGKRPYVFLWIFIVAAVMTPPDVLSQTALGLPMYVLFEVGLFTARRLKRAADAAVDSGRRNLTEDEIEAEFKKQDEAFSGKSAADE